MPQTEAQDVNWSVDVGAVGYAGDSSFDGATQAYRIKGAGVGLSGTADAFHFAYYEIVRGDGQMVVRVASADALAQVNLVLRESLDPGAASAAGTVQNSVAQFVRRTATGNNTVTSGSVSASVPCWLKLVRSGNTVTTFLSADGQTWTELGHDTVTLSNSTVYVGFAVSNGAAGATGTVTASFDGIRSTFLPGEGLNFWLRADAGVTQDANGQISVWADQSGHGTSAAQSNYGSQPQAVVAAVNGLPAVRFDGNGHYFNSNFSGMGGQELTFFVVTKGTNYQSLVRFQGDNGYIVYPWGNNCFLDSADGGNTNGVDSGLTANLWNIGAAVYKSGAQIATYRNGTLIGSRAANSNSLPGGIALMLGSYSGGGEYLSADVAEVMIYNRALSDLQREAVETYLNAKYQVVPALTAPEQVSVTALSSTQVLLTWYEAASAVVSYLVERQNADGSWSAIATVGGGTTRYIDGNLTPGSQYSYRVTATNNFGASPAAVAAGSTAAGNAIGTFPVTGMRLWLMADAGMSLDNNGGLISWTDESGGGFAAGQPSAGNRPIRVMNALNGRPVVHFDGGNSYLNLPSSTFNGLGAAEVFLLLRTASPSGGQRGLWRFTDRENSFYPEFDHISETFGTYNRYGFYYSAALDQFNLYNISATPGVWTARMDSQVLSTSTNNTVDFNASNYLLGQTRDGQRFVGDIAEMMLFDHALSDAERQTVSAYLNTKYAYALPPPVPVQLAATALSASQIALSWNEDPAAAVTGYQVERQNADVSWSIIATLGAGTLSYIDNGVTPGATYGYRVRAINGYGASNPSTNVVIATDPNAGTGAFPVAGMQLWLRADLGTKTDANGGVSTWTDQAGGSHAASQGNAGNRPALIAGDLNGKPALRFDGSRYLDSDYVSGGGQELTLFVVAKGSNYQSLLRFQPAGSGNYLVYPWSASQLFINSADGGTSTGLPCGLVAGQWNIGSAVHKSNDHVATYCNSILVASRTTGGNDLPGGLALEIGRYAGGSEYSQADVAEVLIYNRALSDSERAAVEGYLNGKYAVVAPPGAPTTLAGNAISATQINLLWQLAGSGGSATGFAVERKLTGSSDDFAEVAVSAGNQISAYLDGGLTAGSTYTYRVRAYNAVGYSGYSPEINVSMPAVGALPVSLPAVDALALWLKPDAGITKDANNLVNAWVDASGHGNDALQPSTSSQPQWVDGVINGRPALRFDGNSDSLVTNQPVIPSDTNTTILAVVRLPDTNTRGAFIKNGFYAGFGFGVGNGTLDGTGDVACGIYDYARWLSDGSSWGLGTVLAEMNIDSAGNPAFLRNGVALGSLGGGGPVTSTGPTFIGGYQHDAARFFRGDIAEVLMFSRQLTAAERQGWEDYLNARYAFNPPPAAPTQLSILPLSSSQMALSWSESSSAVSSYTIERQNADGSWSVLAVVGGSRTSYVDSGLAPGTNYQYRVTAANSQGSSPVSSSASGTTGNNGGVAMPLDNLQLWLRADAGVVADTNGRVSVWTDQSGNNHPAAQTEVGRQPTLIAAASAGNEGLPIVRFDGSSTRLDFPDTSGMDNFTIFAMARAASTHEVDGQSSSGIAGTSGQRYIFGGIPWSDGAGSAVSMGTNGVSVYEHAPDYLPPLAVYAGGVGTGRNMVRVRYNAKQSQIFLNTALVCTGLTSPQAHVHAPTMLGGLSYGYFAGDVAEVLVYNGSLTDEQCVAVETYLNGKYAVVTPPEAPLNLAGNAISSSQVNLLWQLAGSGSTATGFSVERKTTGGGDEFAEVAAIAGDQISAYIDEGLTAGNSYTYRVRGYNLAGYSGYSSETNVAVPAAGALPITLPAIDALALWLRPDAGVTKDGNNLVSAWTDVSGHGNDARQSSTSSQPQWIDNALNGHPALRFGGSGQILATTASVIPQNQNVTILAVIALPDANVAGTFVRNEGFSLGVGNNTLENAGNAAVGLYENVRWMPTGQNWGVGTVLAEMNIDASGQPTFYRNGISLGTFAGNAPNYVTGQTTIGGDPLWSARFMRGDIAEVLMFDRVLTDAERKTWESYLNAKYRYIPLPPAPAQLVATALSPTQVAIGWLGNLQNVDGYRVERQNPDGTWSVVATLGPNANSYLVTGLTPGTPYIFRVVANNLTGDSASTNVALTIPATAPALPAGNLRLWLRADSGTVVDANGRLGQWMDDSGNGLTASRNDGNQATVVANVLNGLPVVHFDGNDSYLNLNGSVVAGLGSAEVFVVLRAADPLGGAQRGLWRFTDQENAFYPEWGYICETFGAQNRYTSVTSPAPLDQFNLYNVSAAPGAWRARMNGSVFYESSSNTVNFQADSYSLGRTRSGNSFAGDIAELLLFDRPLTDAERRGVETYLAGKYALASAPAAPANLMAHASSPNQVVLTWQYPQVSSAVRFDIQRAASGSTNYQTVASATGSAGYLDTSADPGTGYVYQVVVTDLAGNVSAASNPASVTTPTVGTSLPTDHLRLWLRADAGATSPVTDWIDQSGNGNNALQSLASVQPSVVANAMSDRPAVRFDGNGSGLRLPAGLFNNITSAEVFVVLRENGPPGGSQGLWRFTDRENSFYPENNHISETFGTYNRYEFGSSAGLDHFNLYNVSAAPGAWTARTNGQTLSSSTNNTVDFNAGSYQLGQTRDGPRFVGDIAELLIFDRALTDDERQAVERYCILRYRLPAFLLGDPDADPDGDGLTNYQEYAAGTDPLDYYNAQPRRISIVSGNTQHGTAGAFVSQPLQVKVTSATGVPLQNAPVIFVVTRANGLLADPAAPASLSSTVTVRTGTDGTATALFQAPPGVLLATSVVTATAGSGALAPHVAFAEAIVDNDDTSGDGLPDWWKARYGFDLTINNASDDPDGDGLTNLQEYRSGTDPTIADATADGVPYAWVLAKGLDPRFDSLATVDPNGTGLTYLQEYQLEQSTVDLWKFDEGAQSTAVVSSAGHRDAGTLVNNPLWTADPDGGAALLFSQPGAQVDVGNVTDGHLDFGASQSFSVTARFLTSNVGISRLVGKGMESTATAGYRVGIDQGRITVGVGVGSAQSQALCFHTVGTFNDGQWHHVAATFDRTASKACVYVDGTIQSLTVDGGSVGASQGTAIVFDPAFVTLSATRPDATFAIGARDTGGAESFVGAIDNVGLFSKALTPAEVKSLAGNQGNTPPVVAISSPLAGTEFPELGTITVQVQAFSPSGAISKVECFNGATKLGEVTSYPYVVTWTQVPVGNYTLTAKATDARGASAVSATISIVVSADSDHDGLPDWWELRYFGNLDQTAAGSYLSDGVSNLDKYRLGLDPTKPVTPDSNNSTGLTIYTPLR